MQYLLIMQGLEPPSDLMHGLPYLRLFDPCAGLEVLVDDTHEVASCRKLHDDAKVTTEVIIEGFFEFDYVLVGE